MAQVPWAAPTSRRRSGDKLENGTYDDGGDEVERDGEHDHGLARRRFCALRPGFLRRLLLRASVPLFQLDILGDGDALVVVPSGHRGRTGSRPVLGSRVEVELVELEAPHACCGLGAKECGCTVDPRASPGPYAGLCLKQAVPRGCTERE